MVVWTRNGEDVNAWPSWHDGQWNLLGYVTGELPGETYESTVTYTG
jgi:hypothetical protein